MFQFTREIILNNQAFATKTNPATGLKELFVDHIGTYRPEYVKSIKKVAAVTEAKEVGEIKIASNTEIGKSYRLKIQIKLSGDVEASYANSLTYFQRPFYVEVVATAADKATIVKQLAATATSMLAKMTDFKIASVVADTTDKITVTANDCYQRIAVLDIEQFTPRGGAQGTLEWEGTWSSVATGFNITTKGTQGHGNGFQLLKNLHLPTMENLRYAGLNQEETPVIGGLYTLYEMSMDVARNIGGAGVVGEKGRSITTHRFWVISTKVNDFETALKATFPHLAGEPVILADPTTNYGDANALKKDKTVQLLFTLGGVTYTSGGKWSPQTALSSTDGILYPSGILEIKKTSSGAVKFNVNFNGWTSKSGGTDITIGG